MESLKIFDEFKFSDLDEDWIKSVWDTEFLTYKEPPDEYLMFLESEDMRLLLHESCIIVKTWLDQGNCQSEAEDEDSDISWNTLIILDVNVHCLLALLGYIMKSGQNNEADEDSRLSCVYATSLYFILLAVPGSNAFNIFHPNLYQRSIETFRMSTYLIPVMKKRNKAINFDSINVNDESPNSSSLTPMEKETLMENLNNVTCDFIMLIKTFSFKNNTQSLDVTIQGLLELTKLEDNGTMSHFHCGQKGSLKLSLLENAYVALQELCDNKHGPANITIMLIMKNILPRMLCSHLDAQAKYMMNIRDASIHFIRALLDGHEKEAKNSVVILIQHLMLKCPDRHEARQKQASILIKLLSICKQNILLEVFKNLMLLSHHAKVSCRIFAQEIIGKLLNESFLMDCNLIESLKIRARNLFLAIILNRCMDSSCMVRGKAMATIAEFTDFSITSSETMFKTMFEKLDPKKEFCVFHDLKKAMSEDIVLLPGSSVLIAMLLDRTEDERALVRRSALQSLKNLTSVFPVLINEVIPVITRRCRDPTLTVRRFSVQVLSQLLQQFPENLYLLEEWVKTVIPQIFDIEVKVQEKVLEYLQELLLHKIKNVSVYTDNMNDNLPWNILNTLTRMKMRRHLSKACNLWAKNGMITNIVVKNVQSHIGTNNNIAAWVFLAALAENTKLPDMEKYISNYKELLETNDFYTCLLLQVLRYSWTSLDREVLKSLYIYLYECLQQFKINFCLISICLDIIHDVIQYLHSNSASKLMESYMLNLIKLSEGEIAKILVNEAAEAAPKCIKAMFTLGNATLMCTVKMSSLTLRILEGVLLEWETLPDAIKKIEQLQASAIVILGQQAIRDREIAQEVIPIFSRLMRQETNLSSVTQIAVKINSAKALADICVRFTALVEPYLPDMCISMKDANPHVREAIMVIFIQLLLEDFIKVKGPFFFHILTMLSDTDDMIRELTVFLIEERLLAKNKTLISQQFLEGIYHYNDYQSQHKFYDRKMREKEKKMLTLPGKRNEEKRRVIYDFMLEHLDPPGKIKILVKITSQLLCGVCNDSVNVRKEEGACVLRDALYIINNEKLQPSSLNKHADDDQQEQEETVVQSPAINVNAVNIIIEGIKKHRLDILLPVLINLRKKLSILKSSLENDVKKIIIKVYSEFNKEQLINVFSEHPNFETEIEQFRRQLGDVSSKEGSSSEEDSSPSDTNIHLNLDSHVTLRALNLTPKVLLPRLSAARFSNWKNTIEISKFPLSPSSIDCWSNLLSPEQCLQINSFSQPGPSTSTPKSSRYLDPSLQNGNDHATKARRLTTSFVDAEVENSFKRSNVERSIPRSHDDSESD